MIMTTVAGRNQIARMTILAHPGWSERRLVRLSHLSRDLIRKVRRKLIDDGLIEDAEKVLGRDGKFYRMNTPIHPTVDHAVDGGSSDVLAIRN